MRNSVRPAPINVDAKTSSERSFCLVMLTSPVTKAEKPAAIPRSIESAKAGLLEISANIVPPAGTDSYNVSVSDVPMKNNTNMMRINPTDHLPKFVFGISPPNFVVFLLINFVVKNEIVDRGLVKVDFYLLQPGGDAVRDKANNYEYYIQFGLIISNMIRSWLLSRFS